MPAQSEILDLIRSEYSSATASAAQRILSDPENANLSFLDLVAQAESNLAGFHAGEDTEVSCRIVVEDSEEE